MAIGDAERAGVDDMDDRDDAEERTVSIPAGEVVLEGTLAVPSEAAGVVLFAHGSGSSRFSPRNQYVAGELRRAGLGTLLIDLLTPDEERVDELTRHHRFDIGLLADRLGAATEWLGSEQATQDMAIGLFGASTGGGAALVTAARNPGRIGAVVSRGGRPDLAGAALPIVKAPTLLIVGGRDPVVLDLNQRAMSQMSAPVRLEVVPNATHLFEEGGALEEVAQLAARWFGRHLPGFADGSAAEA
jgi:putative phosphoribosyl transferase